MEAKSVAISLEYILIAGVAFSASLLTFFSGFGLGTLLAPVFMFFFPVDIAIALTGVVHVFNNLFKGLLIGKYVDKQIFIRFGIPAVLAAFLGAYLLIHFPNSTPIIQYTLWGKALAVYPLKLLIACIVFVFVLWDLLPGLQQLQFGKEKLIFGGLLSGFFGGLSGNQGALRSAFLIKAGLSKEAFVGTAVMISVCVDITRLSVYSTNMLNSDLLSNLDIVILATVSAMLGAFIGNKLLKKVTVRLVQYSVAVFLLIFSVALGLGVI